MFIILTLVRDTDLIQQLLDGNEQAFSSLVERYHGQLLGLARHLTGNTAVAEEVVQDTWIAVIQGVHRFEGRSSLKTWIFRILTYQARKRATREKRTIAWSSMFKADSDVTPTVDPSRFKGGHWLRPPSAWFDSPEDKAIRTDIVQWLEQELPNLPESQRAVVELRDVHGWTAKEVCDALDITSGNQRVLLHRGRARLRERIEELIEAKRAAS